MTYPTDVDSLDVTDGERVLRRFYHTAPGVVFHLAAHKHAPEAEATPADVTRTNVLGTENVVRAARAVEAKVVLASTCKAADPETVYGATKLIAERIVLNAGGVVCRYFNVRESAGNVFRLWESVPESEALLWTSCWRYFITLDDAVDLLVRAVDLPAGRYAIDPGSPRHMHAELLALYPDRTHCQIPRRRGDREAEPLHGASESWKRVGERLFRISSHHDLLA